MRNERHSRILRIIEEKIIGTQDELLDELLKFGIDVTQATISRDIKLLRLTKTLTTNGTYKYVSSEKAESAVYDRLIRVFSESVISIDYANNLIVLKTISAGAQAAAAAIDALDWEEIVGCVAGDDTILVIVRNNALVNDVTDRFILMMKIQTE